LPGLPAKFGWFRPPVRSDPRGREISLPGGGNCNRLYGSRDAHGKSVRVNTSGQASSMAGDSRNGPCAIGIWTGRRIALPSGECGGSDASMRGSSGRRAAVFTMSRTRPPNPSGSRRLHPAAERKTGKPFLPTSQSIEKPPRGVDAMWLWPTSKKGCRQAGRGWKRRPPRLSPVDCETGSNWPRDPAASPQRAGCGRRILGKIRFQGR